MYVNTKHKEMSAETRLIDHAHVNTKHEDMYMQRQDY